VLLNAVLIQIVLPIGFIIYNAYKGELLFPQCFFGYKMDIDKVKKKFVWLMEKIIDDEHVLVLFPKKKDDMEEEIKKLKEAEIERVWVTPQIPFIVPITIGFIISFFIGNLLFGLIQLLT
jgi:preflagellin peptidase FlaK